MKKKLICLLMALALAVPVISSVMTLNDTQIVAITDGATLNGGGGPGDPPPIG